MNRIVLCIALVMWAVEAHVSLNSPIGRTAPFTSPTDPSAVNNTDSPCGGGVYNPSAARYIWRGQAPIQYTIVAAHGGGTAVMGWTTFTNPSFPLSFDTQTIPDQDGYPVTVTRNAPYSIGNFTVQIEYTTSANPPAKYYQCFDACSPSCFGNACGDDGCGSVCGTCGTGSTCVNGNCESDGTACRDSVFYGDQKGQAPDSHDLEACKHHADKTCCSATNSEVLDKALCTADLYESSACKYYSELLTCTACNPDFGIGKRIYPSRTLCDNIWEGCKDEKYFRYDYNSGTGATQTPRFTYFRIDDDNSKKASEIFSGANDFYQNISILSLGGISTNECVVWYDDTDANDPPAEQTLDVGMSLSPQFALICVFLLAVMKNFF